MKRRECWGRVPRGGQSPVHHMQLNTRGASGSVTPAPAVQLAAVSKSLHFAHLTLAPKSGYICYYGTWP